MSIPPPDSLKIQQLKKMAKSKVKCESRGANAVSLFSNAQKQLILGKTRSAQGELEQAYISFSMIGPLIRIAHSRAAVSKDRNMRQETMDFTKVHSGGIIQAMNSLTLFIDGPSRVPYLVRYWDSDSSGQVITGLRNLGKTGYMNASLQCILASLPVSRFFTEIKEKTHINMLYSKGTKYLLTIAFANLVAELVQADPVQVWTPYTFWKTMGELCSKYQNHHQHNAQEFLSFLLDGIHKDINRSIIPFSLSKRAEERKTLENLSTNAASKREWFYWKQRNDSLIVDYFHGQSMDHVQCLTCYKTSTTYNTFSLLHLPMPHSSSTHKISIRACFRALFETNTLEQSDAWFCPHCKKNGRARTRLSLTRLPPTLVIHLKRFEPCCRVSGKIDNFVEFPLNGLDLTNFMPGIPRDARREGLEHASKKDPRVQVPPYKYDLYAVINHDGTLANGHYTAWVRSGDKWMLCDDDTVKEGLPSQVVGREAYILFYKRIRLD